MPTQPSTRARWTLWRPIRELTHGEGAEASMDCTGNPEARMNAVKSAAIWGRVCFVGEGNTTSFEISPDIIHKQLTIYGSWTFSSIPSKGPKWGRL